MLGAVLGDIIGSVYEWHNVKREDFPLFTAQSHFTDDTVLTVAIGELLLNKKRGHVVEYFTEKECAIWLKQYYSRYQNAGFGQMFVGWANAKELYRQRSYANGAAMRVSGIGFAYSDLDSVLLMAKRSSRYTHNHREAIKGAQAAASAVYLARTGKTKEYIKQYLEKHFHYRFCRGLEEMRPDYQFDSRTNYSVPPAIQAFFEANSYEGTIRKAISIGGDSDTIACIAGGIAHAYYKTIPEDIINRGMSLLDAGLRRIVREFCEAFPLD